MMDMQDDENTYEYDNSVEPMKNMGNTIHAMPDMVTSPSVQKLDKLPPPAQYNPFAANKPNTISQDNQPPSEAQTSRYNRTLPRKEAGNPYDHQGSSRDGGRVNPYGRQTNRLRATGEGLAERD